MFRMRCVAVASLLVLLSACAAPPATSSATTAPPSASTAPAPTPTPTGSRSPTVSPTPITLPSFAQLSAPSANVVWALIAGTRLFRSIDRGDSWQERSAAFDPLGPNREIAFISESEGWLATPGSPGTQCTFQAVGIAHTADASLTWAQLVVPAVAPSPDPSGLGGRQCKERLASADAQRGFLSAYDPNSAPVIYRTTDGGRTWSASRSIPDPPDFTTVPSGIVLRADRVRAFGATLLVLVRTSDLRVNYVFRSVDGGTSWSYLVTVPQSEGAFAFVSRSRWLQIASPSSSKETTDSGATWHAFTTDYSQAAPIMPEIVFADALVGYSTVRGAIQRTVDGGAHWVGIKTPGT